MNKHDRPSGGRSAPTEPQRVAGGGVRNRVRLKIDSAGRVLIPADIRAAMELEEGSAVLAWLEDGELHLVGQQVALRQAQDLARNLLVGDGSLADELRADRREEARRERKNG